MDPQYKTVLQLLSITVPKNNREHVSLGGRKINSKIEASEKNPIYSYSLHSYSET